MVVYMSQAKILFKSLECEKLTVYFYAEACKKHLIYNKHRKKKTNGVKKTDILI